MFNITVSEYIVLHDLKEMSAHRLAGMSLKTFVVSSVAAAFALSAQISVFSVLRPRMLHIYQPRCHYVPEHSKVPALHDGFWAWFTPCFQADISDYITLSGLDSYFFLRFLKVLVLISSGSCVFNIPILLPLNYFANDGTSQVSGLDRFSWSNVAPANVSKYNIHSMLAIISLFWVHWIIFYESKLFISIRHSFLSKNDKVESVVMIDNISREFENFGENSLLKAINMLPGGVRNIWFIYDFHEVKRLYENKMRISRNIEKCESGLLRAKWRFSLSGYAKNEGSPISKDSPRASIWQKARHFGDLCAAKSSFFKDPREKLRQYVEDYQKVDKQLKETREVILQNKVPCYRKVFIQFHSRISSYITKQVLLSSNPQRNNFKVIEIDPRDLVWNNVNLNNFWLKRVRYIISIICKIFLVFFWAIPTVFIGLMSQVPNMPFFFKNWPKWSSNITAGILPAISLILITEFVPIFYRTLSSLKGKLTYAQVESDIQNWCFGFFFVHVFLIVTVSSSITVLIQSLVNEPMSIPRLLALTLPKSSNFFFSFILLRGFAYAGGNFLQTYKSIKSFIQLKTKTPRQKFDQISTLSTVKWGSLYPIYAVLGSICLIFATIAPSVSVFSVIAFSMISFSYKYSLRYCTSSENAAETYGKFYPRASCQLYCGIYFAEITLFGLFVILEDQTGTRNASIMACAFFTSVSTHLYINMCYTAAFDYSPLEFLSCETSETVQTRQISCFNCDNYDLTFSHPYFVEDPRKNFVWIPSDVFGNHVFEISFLKAQGIEARSENCIINSNGEVLINGFPTK